MKTRNLLSLILVFSGLGLLLSGYLSYWNIWGPSCHQGPLSWLVSCGGPKKVLIFGLPTCVYGFFMYLAVAVTALLGLAAAAAKKHAAVLIGLGLAGTLFSGGLTVYEVWILKLKFDALPACVYGLVLYIGILTTATVLWRKLKTAAPGTATPPSTPPIQQQPMQ